MNDYGEGTTTSNTGIRQWTTNTNNTLPSLQEQKEVDGIYNQQIDITIMRNTPITGVPPIPPSCEPPTISNIPTGTSVMGIGDDMTHRNCRGNIHHCEHNKIWVTWSDGALTFVNRPDLLLIISKECPNGKKLDNCTQCSKPCEYEQKCRHREKAGKKFELLCEQAKDTVKISTTLHRFLQSELKEFIGENYNFPFMYLLGQKDGIITSAILLRGFGGCKDMQSITSFELTRAYKTINRRKLEVAGLARIGCFGTENNYGLDQIYDMMSDKHILLSMNGDYMWIYKMVKDEYQYRYIRQEWKYIYPHKNEGR